MKRWRQCYPDEHYVPSLLAREGLDNATDCHGGIMSVDWTTKDWHPVTYTAANVSADLCEPLCHMLWDTSAEIVPPAERA